MKRLKITIKLLFFFVKGKAFLMSYKKSKRLLKTNTKMIISFESTAIPSSAGYDRKVIP